MPLKRSTDVKNLLTPLRCLPFGSAPCRGPIGGRPGPLETSGDVLDVSCTTVALCTSMGRLGAEESISIFPLDSCWLRGALEVNSTSILSTAVLDCRGAEGSCRSSTEGISTSLVLSASPVCRALDDVADGLGGRPCAFMCGGGSFKLVSRPCKIGSGAATRPPFGAYAERRKVEFCGGNGSRLAPKKYECWNWERGKMDYVWHLRTR